MPVYNRRFIDDTTKEPAPHHLQAVGPRVPVETKAQDNLSQENVRLKQLATIDWINRINQLRPEDRGNAEWEYVLLGERTFYGLSSKGASILEVFEYAKMTRNKIEGVLIAYNIIEAVVSIGFGLLAGSIALVGFGLDSVIEVASASILVWRLSHQGEGAEETRKEKMALFFVGLTLFFLAVYILYESGAKLLHQEMPEKTVAGIVIAMLSVVIMPILGLSKRNIAKELGSKALEADAIETLVCAYLSLTLLLGLGLNVLFGWWWADPGAALIMIYFLIAALSSPRMRGGIY